MDVLAGPTFTIDSSRPPPPYEGNRRQTNAGDRAVQSYGFFAGDSSESSSSIGTPDDSEDENDVVSPKRDQEEEQEVQSKFKGLASLDSLEDSLSIKRGLSSHFVGKSMSFTDLSQVSTVKELQKQENPLNKRRRVLIASKRSRRSFYSFSNPKSMPLLPLNEDEDEDFEEEKTKTVSSSSSTSSSSPLQENKPQDQVLMREQNRVPKSYATQMRLRLGSFKSRSLSLVDLQEHDEKEEDEEDDD